MASTRKGVVAERLFTRIEPPSAAVYRGTTGGVVGDVDGRTRVEAILMLKSAKTLFPESDAVQSIPFVEYIIRFVPVVARALPPVATHLVPFHAIFETESIRLAAEVDAVHVSPSDE